MDRLARGVRQPVLRGALATLDVVTARGIGQGSGCALARNWSHRLSPQAHTLWDRSGIRGKRQATSREPFGGHHFPAQTV